MKKLFLSAFFLGAIATSFTSCSSNDDTSDPGTAPDTSSKYQHRVLIEDVTGSWCQWCPRVSYSIEQVVKHETLGDKIIPVAVHYGDKMQISAGNTLNTFFKVSGYPFALVNRDTRWKSPENNNLAQVYNAINKDGSPIGIKISSNLTDTGGTVTASFKFSSGYENLKYVIYILENDVVRADSPQKNSTTYYGGNGNPNSPSSHPEFIHQDVLMATSGDPRGNELGTVSPGQEVIKSEQKVTYKLNNNDLSKVDVVVFITDTTGKKVLNVQKAKANTTQDYEKK